ncbi:MAG: rod shape-determining protein MreD [Actinomycetota bacterium]
MRRLAAFSLIVLLAVLLQNTVFAGLKMFGVSPDIVVVVVVCFAMLEGPTTGAMVGFWGGLLRDLFLSAPKGLTGLSYLLVGYVVGIVRPYVESTSVLVPVAGVFFGSLGAAGLYEILEALLGRQGVSLGKSIKVVVLLSVYNSLLAPFIYPVVRRAAMIERPKRVYLW